MAFVKFTFALWVATLLLVSLAFSAVTIPKCKQTDVAGAKGWLFSFPALATEGMKSKEGDRAPGAANLLKKIRAKGGKCGVLSNRFDGADDVWRTLSAANLQVDYVYTAADAIVAYLKEDVTGRPPVEGTKVLVLTDRKFDFIAKLYAKLNDYDLYKSMDFMGSFCPIITMDKVLEWAELSRSGKNKVVVVAAFNHYPQLRDTTLNYDLSRKVNILLRNGATFVVGALDSARYDEESGLYLPALGAFEALHLTSAEIPASDVPTEIYANTGKGGNAGVRMFEDAIRGLAVGVNAVAIQPKDVIMVGDSLMTDIAGAKKAGLKKAILVLGGLNTKVDAENSTDTLSDPHCYVDTLIELGALLPD